MIYKATILSLGKLVSFSSGFTFFLYRYHFAIAIFRRAKLNTPLYLFLFENRFRDLWNKSLLPPLPFFMNISWECYSYLSSWNDDYRKYYWFLSKANASIYTLDLNPFDFLRPLLLKWYPPFSVIIFSLSLGPFLSEAKLALTMSVLNDNKWQNSKMAV